MELSGPRKCGAQDAKPTHDFLSLCSPAQQDPTPTIPGGYFKTHDFLQPLEQDGKNVAKEGNMVEVTCVEKSLSPAPPTMVEHILPGGIGTYSISRISYINQSQKVPKPEGVVISAAQSSSSNYNDENSNCSSYTGSGFTLWEESNVKNGKTGKENVAGTRHALRDGGIKIGVPWTASMKRPSQSSSIHNHPSTTFSSLSSSHPLSSPKNQCFVDMWKSAKGAQEEEDNDDEEFVIKKEPSSHHKGALLGKVDSANPDQKPNTPRSKHSATEQRRRSKINDRFSMLRGVIPHGDQKRDKASFLLEVIEYIQFLQDKVHKYEDSHQGRTNEPPKMIPLSSRQTEGFIDQPQPPNSVSGPSFVFSEKSKENNSTSVAPTIPTTRQNLLDSNTSSFDAIRVTSQHPQSTNKPLPFAAASQTHTCPDTATTASHAQPRLWHSRSCTTDCTVASDKLKDQELITESGTISISTIYSEGLSSALSQALKSLGVDLSQANISVQIDLGKGSNTSTLDSSASNLKENETPCIDQALARSRLASTWEEKSGEAFKRLKTSRN